MRRIIFGVIAASILLGGCNKKSTAETESPGRYAGIGLFEVGRLWREMIVAVGTADPAAAKIADDEHIIVVVDSHTGEVRQCGDHSGYCIAMNPWKKPPALVPVQLTKHAADLDAEGNTTTSNKKIAAPTAVVH